MEDTIYHVWFATKRRIWLLEGDIRRAARDCLISVADEKHIQLIECGTTIDHVHLLLRLDKGASLPRAMNLLKGISSYRLRSLFPQLKEGELDNLWQRGYAFRLVAPGSLAQRRRYVRSQQQRLDEQLRKALLERTSALNEGMPRPSGRGRGKI